MKTLIVGLLTVVGAASLSAQGQYSHGTAVIALPTGNQMVFAADSAGSYGSAITNDACKITRIDDKTIFTQAGVGGIGPNDKSFINKAAQLIREKPIRTQEDLKSVATSWTQWVIRALNDSITTPANLRELSSLSPVEAIFATVNDKNKVIIVTSRFDIVDIGSPGLNLTPPNGIQPPQIQNAISPGDEGSKAFGLRFGDIEELRQQTTYWSHQVVSNAQFRPLLASIDRPGNTKLRKANAKAFMTVVAPTSAGAVGGDTDIILLGPKGARWLKRKRVCPETWR